MDCDESNLSEVIEEAEDYISEVMPYAIDIIERIIDSETGDELSGEIIQSWHKEPLKEINWFYHGETTIYERYNQLTDEQKSNLPEFEIMSSIIASDENNEISITDKERLLKIIREVWLKDEDQTALSHIADEITEACIRGETTVDILSSANPRDILVCITGFESFEDLNNQEEESL